MSKFRVRLTKRALGHLQRIDTWWRENRLSSPELFDSEATKALDLLAEAPLAGVIYRRLSGPPIRRLLLIETRYHIYFDTNEDAGEVLVVAVWHASRDRPPPISPR
jgi:plasmid stabilization system protein ParE